MDSTTSTPIATASFVWSEDYFNQFFLSFPSQKIAKQVNVWGFRLLVLMGLGFLLIASVSNDLIAGCIGVFMIIYSIFCNRYARSYSGSAIYKTYKMYHDLPVRYKFYNTYFVVEDEYSISTIPYNMLYQIIHSKHGYTLCVGKAIGLFLPESECSDSLSQLLEEKQREINS